MPQDPRHPFWEDLYEPTRIYLFGKHFRSLVFAEDDLDRSPDPGAYPAVPPAVGDPFAGPAIAQHGGAMPPPRLERSLRRVRRGAQIEFVPAQGEYQINPNAQLRPRLARIYSFSFEGHYYKLPRPLVYLVWGNGIPPEEPSDLTGGAQRRWIGPTGAQFGLPAGGGKGKGWPTFEAGNTGIEGKGWRFASDILVWTLDREDMSMCIDIDVGTLDQILLGASLDFEAGMADARASAAGRALPASRASASARASAVARASAGARASAAFRASMLGAHQDD